MNVSNHLLKTNNIKIDGGFWGMHNKSSLKYYIAVGICFLGVMLALPNVLPQSILDKMPQWFPKNTVYLGLDLSGGSHLLLEVDLNYANKEKLSQTAQEVRSILRKNNITFSNLSVNESLETLNTVHFDIDDVNQIAHVQNLVRSVDRDFNLFVKGQRFELSQNDASIRKMHNDILEKSIEVIRRRIDASGTREPVITRHGSGRILVQIPGVQDPTRVKSLIGRTAKLTFRLVEDSAPEVSSKPVGTFNSGYQYLPFSNGRGYIAIKNQVMVGGDTLTDARHEYDEYNRSQVSFKFNPIGAKRFAKATSENVGKRFAIVLDGKVISAPTIQEAITGGSGRITSSGFGVQEATDLALLLRAGALPTPLKIVEERTIGPGLGSDSIKAGTMATIIAVLSVLIFMVMAYDSFGLIAGIAVVFNIILLIAALSCLQATLTLPGIAGIALTVGMAVDANVLINERIREEMRHGTKPRQAIEAGYKRAFSSIVDSNLTTLFGTACLYMFGSGPIKGFAVTLSLGIFASMFTAIVLTRLIVDNWLLKGTRLRKNLSI